MRQWLCTRRASSRTHMSSRVMLGARSFTRAATLARVRVRVRVRARVRVSDRDRVTVTVTVKG